MNRLAASKLIALAIGLICILLAYNYNKSATYKISGDSATESYDAMGIDAAIVFHQESVFVKAGMHSSELNGVGSIKIGSTTYSVTETISGSGFLVGAGLNLDDTRYGITYYSDMGGDADSDMTFLYAGVVF